jgi:hypothetical protein
MGWVLSVGILLYALVTCDIGVWKKKSFSMDLRRDYQMPSLEFGRLSAIPACGVNERLVDFLRDYGVGS